MRWLLCLVGRHAWLYDANDHSQRTCMRLRCSWGKDRLGCRHFWRDWRWRHMQLYTNACRPCRAKFARSHGRAVTVTLTCDTSAFEDGCLRAAEAGRAIVYRRRIQDERRRGLAFVREIATQARRDLGLEPPQEAAGAPHSAEETVSRGSGAGSDGEGVSGACGCWTCNPSSGCMIVCPECGNKRCPRATHHVNACTGSNEPGQDGSRYA